MFTITVKYDEKKSTTSQYENVMAGVLIERSHLELHTPEELLQKTAELFALARTAVRRELNSRDSDVTTEQSQPAPRRALPRPSEPAPSQSRDRGPNGGPPGRRPFRGRPDPEPTPKQKALLHRIAKDRHLGPESIREICERLVGQPVESLDRNGMSRLIECLINGQEAA